MENRIDKSFLGTGWRFPPSFNFYNRTTEMVTELEDIQQSIFLLLSTAPGERIMNPAYGCDLNSMVFERMTEATRQEIMALVEQAIDLFEPRIIIEQIEVNMASFDPGKLEITIEFSVIRTNSRSNIVFPFYLKEGTNVYL